jgi:hypothetical protein
MKRLGLLAIIGAVAMLAVTAMPAVAAKPQRFPGTPFTGSFKAGDVCAFQVDTAPVEFKVIVKVFSDSSGDPTRIEFRGRDVIEVTNHDTGKRLVFNASGPGNLYPQPDSSILAVGGGPSLFALFQGDDRGPAMLYVKGRATFTITPTGSITKLVTNGPVADVCAMLAA